jgi:hypothetical protein
MVYWRWFVSQKQINNTLFIILILDWIVVPLVHVLAQLMIEDTGQRLRLNKKVHARPGVKSKASTKFIERTAKHPDA